MSLISMKFLLFVLIAVIGYYSIPKKIQWIWLLILSYIYYASSGIKIVFFILFSTITTYMAGILLHKISTNYAENQDTNKSLKKQQIIKQKRFIVVATLILNFGMLGVLKYTNFVIDIFNHISGEQIPFFNFLLPLGISFYTFQSMGYLLDVYWERYKPEFNFFRFALFVSFFPQILQGPISRFDRLAHQLFEEHTFKWEQAEASVQRILWGFFKKMVLADNAAMFVDGIFNRYQEFPGLSIVAVLGYSIQLYGDFSGGIDVVIGIAGLFGIKLEENFKQPFFARSISDFWHRWHITLGTWMKDYIFYPISLSKWMSKFGKFSKKTFGKKVGRTLPICVANIVVFLVVGIWHGAAWKFIVYGLYNGFIIAFSGLMAANYQKWRKACHINDKSKVWIVFQIVRTFILVNISWFFDRADSVRQALIMMKNAVTHFEMNSLLNGSILETGKSVQNFSIIILIILLFGCAIVFVVSFMQENKIAVQQVLLSRPVMIRWAVYLMLLFALPILGQPPTSSGGFIYAQF